MPASEILPFRFKDKRKGGIAWNQTRDWTPYMIDLDTSWPRLPYDYTAKTVQENYWTYPSYSIFQPEVKVSTVPTEKVKTATWADWLGEYMEVTRTEIGTDSMEVTGLVRVPEDKQPDSDKATVVYLTTRFLALMDRVKKEGMPLTRLPEIVIGQVGNGYQAQVTLTIRSDWPTGS